MIYERTDYFTHNNLKSRSRSHRTERDVGSKREGIINVVEVLASPYILTLILSFVLSDYSSKIRDCKLKMYIIYAQIGFSTNRQTFNKNIATAEKSPIFTSHKS
jgi:hypothetical protein